MDKTHHPSNILLAVDGSTHANAATQLLDDLIRDSSCSITIVAVLDTPHTLRRQLLLDAIRQSQEALAKPGRLVTCGLLHGNPASAICDFADQHAPDFIIMGAVGRRATLGILLGGVAQQVVEYSHQPVLIARLAHQGLKNILITTDGSEYSKVAINFLGCLPLDLSTNLHIVNVTNPYPPFETSIQPRAWMFGNDIFLPPTYPEDENSLWHEKALQGGQRIIESALLEIQPCNLPFKTSILHGDAATEILDYAKRNEIDLIITGSRGLSEVEGWLLGSVSRKLVHYSNCSVLVVKSSLDR